MPKAYRFKEIWWQSRGQNCIKSEKNGKATSGKLKKMNPYADEVREAMNAQFKKYISEMDQLGPSVTSSILKAKSQREGQTTTLDAPVHPSKFSAHAPACAERRKT